jgi:hypothetical protein
VVVLGGGGGGCWLGAACVSNFIDYLLGTAGQRC